MMKKIQTIPFWKKHPSLISGFSTKALGNVSFRVGDKKTIQLNREILFRELGIDRDSVIILPLSHSNRVLSVPIKEFLVRNNDGIYVSGGHVFSDTHSPVHNNSEWQSGIDAIVTNMSGIFPMIMSADCAAVGFFDHKKNVLALAHAGLIGVVNHIILNTVECMVVEYRSDPEDIEVTIFPSIRNCHYDLSMSGVWKRIKRDISAYYGESDQVFTGEKFDLQALIQRQLMTSGITEDHIYDVNLCTVCNRNMFFSNFAAKNPEAKRVEGRFASIMGVKNET